jgi:large subunit ribosomal protein L13
MIYKTKWTKPSEIKREWYIIDVKDQILGRASTQIASLLIGKGKTELRPGLDCGDYVIVVNSDKVKLTGGKELKKLYRTHSGYPGGLKKIRFDEQIKKDSRQTIVRAVKNMLPKDKIRDIRMTRLFIYKGEDHKHEAQKPKDFKLSTK